MPTVRRAYIYALEAGFSQVAQNCQVFCQTVGGVFLTFLPKIKDDNSICQTAGDALILLVLLSSKHFDCKFFVIIFKVSFLENSDYNIYPLLGNWTIIIANTFATKSSSIADEPRI